MEEIPIRHILRLLLQILQSKAENEFINTNTVNMEEPCEFGMSILHDDDGGRPRRHVGWALPLLRAALFLLLAACSPGGAWADDPWLTMEQGDFRVFYAPGKLEDARKMADFAVQAKAIVSDALEFSEAPGAGIYLYPLDRWTRSYYIAYADPVAGSLHFLTPSDQPADSSADDLWYFKNVIHEYAHLATLAIMEKRSGGYSYQEVPELFTEGVAEFIAVMRSTSEIQARYVNILRIMKQTVDRGESAFLFLDDVYTWGPFFIEFLEDTFGNGAILRLLLSKAPTFPCALLRVFGVDALELESRWIRWIADYVDRVQWPVAYSAGINRRFEVENSDFVRGGSIVMWQIAALEPLPSDAWARLFEADGVTVTLMTTREEIRAKQSEWAANQFAGLMRIYIPVVRDGDRWISAVPVTLRPFPGVVLYWVDQYGHWRPGGVKWIDSRE